MVLACAPCMFGKLVGRLPRFEQTGEVRQDLNVCSSRASLPAVARASQTPPLTSSTLCTRRTSGEKAQNASRACRPLGDENRTVCLTIELLAGARGAAAARAAATRRSSCAACRAYTTTRVRKFFAPPTTRNLLLGLQPRLESKRGESHPPTGSRSPLRHAPRPGPARARLRRLPHRRGLRAVRHLPRRAAGAPPLRTPALAIITRPRQRPYSAWVCKLPLLAAMCSAGQRRWKHASQASPKRPAQSRRAAQLPHYPARSFTALLTQSWLRRTSARGPGSRSRPRGGWSPRCSKRCDRLGGACLRRAARTRMIAPGC